MEKKTFLCILISYIKDHIKIIFIYSIFIMIFIAVFSLYSLELEAIVYSFLLSCTVAVIFIVCDFIKYYRKHNQLYDLKKQITISLEKMPLARNLIEKNYQNILVELYNNKIEMNSKADMKRTEMMDYYTLWAHQIKTPISAMRLLLQMEQSEENKELLAELFKIEQYVEMVLCYLRIENSSSDLVLKNCDLSQIIKQAVRKYANTFIRKNISLEFNEVNCTVLTDEKWLVFVIEQILSNALKYTNEGKISIYMCKSKEKVLVIEDTGIGIAKEDLPRIFENGYTGYNGRMDKKATGIGLYLCKKILNKLSHKIIITSEIGVGTTVKIDLFSAKTMFE
ncbi:sensor histidine kinase [Clostridium senegalense]|uniref:sensor histidine kinase n=1 Tax=Clostridium senegalense TaxID=1465809 RepID=UPI001C0F7544|nr:sensor histidine kinase [Clostridium senegalense]MBU5227233.1 sensor histidine kinase [Clostridium senegalense]